MLFKKTFQSNQKMLKRLKKQNKQKTTNKTNVKSEMCVKYAKNYSDKILLHVHLSSVPVSSLEVPVDFVSCLHSEPLWNTSVLVEFLA